MGILIKMTLNIILQEKLEAFSNKKRNVIQDAIVHCYGRILREWHIKPKCELQRGYLIFSV